MVELLLLKDKEKGRNILLPENAYNLSGSVPVIYVENHADECVELCVGQKLGTIHAMCIDKQAWIKEELRGSTKVEGCKNLHFNRRLWDISRDTDRRGKQRLYSFY